VPKEAAEAVRRRFQTRRQEAQSRELGASVMQAAALAYAASRQVARMMDARAATKIQAEWRGFAIRQSKESEEVKQEVRRRRIEYRESEAAIYVQRAAQVFFARREVSRRAAAVRRGLDLERAEEAEREAEERMMRMAEAAAEAVEATSESEVRRVLQPRAPNTSVPKRSRPSSAPVSRADKPPLVGGNGPQRPKPPSSAGVSRGAAGRIAGTGARPVAWLSLRSANWTPSPRRQYTPSADISLDI